jgi:hypothetical protein
MKKLCKIIRNQLYIFNMKFNCMIMYRMNQIYLLKRKIVGNNNLCLFTLIEISISLKLFLCILFRLNKTYGANISKC